MPTTEAPPAMTLRGMTKSFAGVTVLRDVDLDIAPGEVHALVGENGSGKSTLVKILAGVQAPDAGSAAWLWGAPLDFPVVRPHRQGLAVIHQDLGLVDGMSVAENIGVANGFDTRSLAPIRRRREDGLVRELSTAFGVDLSPGTHVSDLSPAERSLVAILRALRQFRGQRRALIVLDEPTASLPRAESLRLLSLVRSAADDGASVIFIGHRLEEVLSVSDRVSVLRSGSLVGTYRTSDVTQADVVRAMLGYELGDFYPDKEVVSDVPTALTVDGLSGGSIDGLTLQVRSGEILGITGLAGMGQEEVPYLLSGAIRRTAGSVVMDAGPVGPHLRDSQAAGMALIPGNRTRDAIWTEGTATENLTIPMLHRFCRRAVLRRKAERAFTEQVMASYTVRPSNEGLQLGRFSGGNQQKIVVARWLQERPKVLVLHEPTQGVDAGAKKDILGLVQRAASAGTAVVICSSDSEEVAQLCHRALVMRFGSVVSEIPREQLTQDAIVLATQQV